MLDGIISKVAHQLDRLKIWDDQMSQEEIFNFLEELKSELGSAQNEFDSEYQHKDHAQAGADELEELRSELQAANEALLHYYECIEAVKKALSETETYPIFGEVPANCAPEPHTENHS